MHLTRKTFRRICLHETQLSHMHNAFRVLFNEHIPLAIKISIDPHTLFKLWILSKAKKCMSRNSSMVTKKGLLLYKKTCFLYSSVWPTVWNLLVHRVCKLWEWPSEQLNNCSWCNTLNLCHQLSHRCRPKLTIHSPKKGES